jgi:hypothetical protein
MGLARFENFLSSSSLAASSESAVAIKLVDPSLVQLKSFVRASHLSAPIFIDITRLGLIFNGAESLSSVLLACLLLSGLFASEKQSADRINFLPLL